MYGKMFERESQLLILKKRRIGEIYHHKQILRQCQEAEHKASIGKLVKRTYSYLSLKEEEVRDIEKHT